jgi:hypothetical protein
MDSHPTIDEVAAHVRRIYFLELNFFNCALSDWDGARKNVFLTTKSRGRIGIPSNADHVDL